MGQITIPAKAVVGIDANILIYHVEHYAPYEQISLPLWNMLDQERITVITSELIYLEVLIKPTKEQQWALVEQYKTVMQETAGFHLLPIDFAVLETAIELRVNHNLKTPDAIHAATALLNKCQMFVTNDPIFKRVTELNAVVLTDFEQPA